MTHICIGKLTTIGSDNGLSPGRRQAIIWTNHCWDIVNWALGNKLQWNFNRYSNIFIQENAFENVVCEMASICLGLNVLMSVRGAGMPFEANSACQLSSSFGHDNWHHVSVFGRHRCFYAPVVCSRLRCWIREHPMSNDFINLILNHRDLNKHGRSQLVIFRKILTWENIFVCWFTLYWVYALVYTGTQFNALRADQVAYMYIYVSI